MAGVEGRDDRELRLQAMNAVLRVAARHANLLEREVFEAIGAALCSWVSFGRMAVVVPEDTEQVLYAASFGDAASQLPPFGARFPLPDRTNQELVMQGGVRVVDDVRLGDAVDRIVAESGYLSYVALPIQRSRVDSPDESGRPVAKLIFCWRAEGAAGLAPIELLQEVADLFGSKFDLACELTRAHRRAMILETSGDAMLAWDARGRITDANAAALVLTGLTPGELLGASIHELVGPLPEPSKGASPNGAMRAELVVRRDQGGSTARLPVSMVLTRVEDDPHVTAHALLRDESHVVAAQHEAASHLARVHVLQAELRTLLDNAPLIIFRLDSESGELQYLSRQAERVLGIPLEEALRTPGFLRAAHDGADAVHAFDEACRRARFGTVPPPYEARLVVRDREKITVRGTVYPLLSEGGRVAAIEGVLIDVSIEHMARTKLLQADSLSTIGVLAAGVAHEINNPAAFLLLELGHLERELSACSTEPLAVDGELSVASVVARIAELRQSVVHIADIARDLRMFAGTSKRQDCTMMIDVNRAVESALTLTRGRIIQNARVVLELGPVSPVLMDQGRLGQVIVNLLVNAAQAIACAREEEQTEHTVRIGTHCDGQTVRLEVSDTGVGIPAENLEKIWTPFFTTKGDVGTGLGLSISRDIVERAKGTIHAESPIFETATGRHGARFVVTLPTADCAFTSLPPRCVSQPRSGRRLRVLVVEDEVGLARALVEEIEKLHDVVAVHNGGDALAAIVERRFDVVLCDLLMPGLSGEDLYRQVSARDDEQARAFVFMTALGSGADVEQFLTECGRPILEKPFAVDRLFSLLGQPEAVTT